MLVDWGLERADQKMFETYLDATEEGCPLYQACGFAKADRVDFCAPRPNPSKRWKELQSGLLPFSFWPMWRPIGGHIEPVTTMTPWEVAK